MARRPATAGSEPSPAELTQALRQHVDGDGAVPVGVAVRLERETGWHGRLLAVVTADGADGDRMAYLVGGHRPDEVARWLSAWAESPRSQAPTSPASAIATLRPDWDATHDLRLLHPTNHLPSVIA